MMKRFARFYRLMDWRSLFLWLFLYASACASYSLWAKRVDSFDRIDIAGMAIIGAILFGVPIKEVWRDSKRP